MSWFRFHIYVTSHGICPSQEQVWIEGKRNTGQGRAQETEDPEHKLWHTDTTTRGDSKFYGAGNLYNGDYFKKKKPKQICMF